MSDSQDRLHIVLQGYLRWLHRPSTIIAQIPLSLQVGNEFGKRDADGNSNMISNQPRFILCKAWTIQAVLRTNSIIQWTLSLAILRFLAMKMFEICSILSSTVMLNVPSHHVNKMLETMDSKHDCRLPNSLLVPVHIMTPFLNHFQTAPDTKCLSGEKLAHKPV